MSSTVKLKLIIAANGQTHEFECDAALTVSELKTRIFEITQLDKRRQILLFEYVNLSATQTLDILAENENVGALVHSLSISKSTRAAAQPAKRSASTSDKPVRVFLFDRLWVNAAQRPALRAAVVDERGDLQPALAGELSGAALDRELVAWERKVARDVRLVGGLRRRIEAVERRCSRSLREQAAQREAIEATVDNLVAFHVARVERALEKTTGLVEHHDREQARVLATFDADVQRLQLIALHPNVATQQYRTLADMVDVASYRERARVVVALRAELQALLGAFEELTNRSRVDADSVARSVRAAMPALTELNSVLLRVRDASLTAVSLEARMHTAHAAACEAALAGDASAVNRAELDDVPPLIEQLRGALDAAEQLQQQCRQSREASAQCLFDAMRLEKPVAELVGQAQRSLGSLRPLLRRWRTDIGRLADVHRYPHVYVNTLAEVSRRLEYAATVREQFVEFADQFNGTHAAELAKRRAWNKANLRFVAPLFPIVQRDDGQSISSLAFLPRLRVECPSFDDTLPLVKRDDVMHAAYTYNVKLDSEYDCLTPGGPTDAPENASAPSPSKASASENSANDDDDNNNNNNNQLDDSTLAVYKKRIEELEARLEEQFSRARSETMDKSVRNAASESLRRVKREQRDAEKQRVALEARLASATAKASEAERALEKAKREHESILAEVMSQSISNKGVEEEFRKERERFMAIVAAANKARGKAESAVQEARAELTDATAQLAQNKVEVEQQRAELADKERVLTQQRAALQSVIGALDTPVHGDNDDDTLAVRAVSLAQAAKEQAEPRHVALGLSRIANDKPKLSVCVGELRAGDVALFLPRMNNSGSGSSKSIVYEALTQSSRQLQSLAARDADAAGAVRYFLDVNALDAFRDEIDQRLPIIGEIVALEDRAPAAEAPVHLASILESNDSFALAIVARHGSN